MEIIAEAGLTKEEFLKLIKEKLLSNPLGVYFELPAHQFGCLNAGSFTVRLYRNSYI